MRNYKAYEFSDLSKEVQAKVREREINTVVEMSMQELGNDLEHDRITEADYYKELGCSKSYAESTAWFVPSCYYEKHEKEVNRQVEEYLQQDLYTASGTFIAVK